MPRRWRVDRVICHIYNRAAAKQQLFQSSHDYRAFLEILGRTKADAHPAIRLYGYCVMPTHWHLIICADTTPALSQFMRHLTRRHAISYLAEHPERSGAVYQGRFRCVPVQSGHHLRTLLLYVDRNPLTARLVSSSEEWLWSSVLHHAGMANDPLLDVDQLPESVNWLDAVNRTDADDALMKAALARNVPIGDQAWVAGLSGEWNDLRRRPGRPGKLNREELSETNAGAAGLDRANPHG